MRYPLDGGCDCGWRRRELDTNMDMDEESTMHDSEERKNKDLPIEARHSICLEIAKKMRQSVESSIFIPNKRVRKSSRLLDEIQPSGTDGQTSQQEVLSRQEMKVKKILSSKKASEHHSVWKKFWKLRSLSGAHKQRQQRKQPKDQVPSLSAVPLKHPESYPIVKQTITSDRIRSVVESLRDEKAPVLEPEPQARQTQVIAQQLQLGQDQSMSISYTYEIPETETPTATEAHEVSESAAAPNIVGYGNIIYMDSASIENSSYHHRNQLTTQESREHSSSSYRTAQAESCEDPLCRYEIKVEDPSTSESYIDQSYHHPPHDLHPSESRTNWNFYEYQDSQCLPRLRPNLGFEPRENFNVFTTVSSNPSSSERYEANREPQRLRLQRGQQHFHPDPVACPTNFINYNSIASQPSLQPPEVHPHYQPHINHPNRTIDHDFYHHQSSSRTTSMNYTNYCRHHHMSNMRHGQREPTIMPTNQMDYATHSVMQLNKPPQIHYYQKLSTNPQYFSESVANLYDFVRPLNTGGAVDLTMPSLVHQPHPHPPFHYPPPFSNYAGISESHLSQLQCFTHAYTHHPDPTRLELFDRSCWQRDVLHDLRNARAHGPPILPPPTEIFHHNRLF